MLFIDNLHMLINGTDGNSQEEYNALGHLAGDDSLRLITTSTFRAWRQTFSKDDLLTRRLQTVELAPVSRDEALRIVTGVLPRRALRARGCRKGRGAGRSLDYGQALPRQGARSGG